MLTLAVLLAPLLGLPLVMVEKQSGYGAYATKAQATRAPFNRFAHYREFGDVSNRSIVGLCAEPLDEWEAPRLCRGGSRSLTAPGAT